MRRFGRIIVITKKTQMQELLDRYVTVAQARFYIEHMGLSFEEYEVAHKEYIEAKEQLRAALPESPRHMFVDRSFLPTFLFEDRDLVITLGGDGLVVNTAKYARRCPILALSHDRRSRKAVLVPFHISEAKERLRAVIRGDFREKQVTMAEAVLNDGQRLLGFNDIFIGHRSHVSARYHIESGKNDEEHISSGIIVSTGAGSTGWLKSVLAGSLGVIREVCPEIKNLPGRIEGRFDWAQDLLRFAVREPFPSDRSEANIVFGTITAGNELMVESHMPEGGVIFSDGIEQDAITFNSGAVAKIGIAEDKATLIMG